MWLWTRWVSLVSSDTGPVLGVGGRGVVDEVS